MKRDRISIDVERVEPSYAFPSSSESSRPTALLGRRLTLEIGEDALVNLSDLQRGALYNGLLLLGAAVGTRDYLDMLLGGDAAVWPDPDAQEDSADA